MKLKFASSSIKAQGQCHASRPQTGKKSWASLEEFIYIKSDRSDVCTFLLDRPSCSSGTTQTSTINMVKLVSGEICILEGKSSRGNLNKNRNLAISSTVQPELEKLLVKKYETIVMIEGRTQTKMQDSFESKNFNS